MSTPVHAENSSSPLIGASTDPEYQAFAAELERDPKPLPSAETLADRRAAEGGGAQLEAKRVTSLMQFLQDKWSGKAPAAEPPNARGVRFIFPGIAFGKHTINACISGTVAKTKVDRV